jgi:hypothetical protein
MQATIQSTFTATSSAPPTQTDLKESIMKSRHFTYLWNTSSCAAAGVVLQCCFGFWADCYFGSWAVSAGEFRQCTFV